MAIVLNLFSSNRCSSCRSSILVALGIVLIVLVVIISIVDVIVIVMVLVIASEILGSIQVVALVIN